MTTFFSAEHSYQTYFSLLIFTERKDDLRRSRQRSTSDPSPCVCPAWARCNRVKVPCIMNSIKQRILDYGNCGIARFRGKEAYVKDMSPRTGTGYKADGVDKLAPHSEVRSSVPEVNPGVVYRNSALLPGETSHASRPGFNLPERVGGADSNVDIEMRGVSRDHSSPVQRAGSSLWGEESGGLSQDEGSNRRSGDDRRGL